MTVNTIELVLLCVAAICGITIIFAPQFVAFMFRAVAALALLWVLLWSLPLLIFVGIPLLLLLIILHLFLTRR